MESNKIMLIERDPKGYGVILPDLIIWILFVFNHNFFAITHRNEVTNIYCSTY